MAGGILVTGGAGYIGSHVVKLLTRRGERVVVLDDLSTGFAEAVLGAQLVQGDIGDRALVARLLREERLDTVMHFAARTVVPDSVADPLTYYEVNTCGTRALLQSCLAAGVRHFIFSSTAAVYGIPASGVANEASPTLPINPYGTSKLMAEWMLRDLQLAGGPDYAVLRYFNVAGADPEGELGQSTRKATLLIKVACEVALGKRPYLSLFGTDYATPDGTCIRDYIHVMDLADAHLRALDYLRGGGKPVILNCGYGRGYSVREVIAALEAVTGNALPVREANRRPGDPPALIAEAARLRELLDWRPRHDDLRGIVSTALAWERRLGAPGAPGRGGALLTPARPSH